MSAPKKPWHYAWKVCPNANQVVWIRAANWNWPPVLAELDIPNQQFTFVIESLDELDSIGVIVPYHEVHSWREQ